MSALPIISFQSLRGRLIRPLLAALAISVVVGEPQSSAAKGKPPIDDAAVLVGPDVPQREVLHQASIRYRVSHPLARFEGVLDASHVESKIVFNEDKPEKTSGSVVVALVGFSSRNTARDRHAQRSLETGVFPSARLELRGLQRVVLHKAAEEHETRFKGACRADLYLHGQRSDWPVEVELQWSKDELVVLSSFTILLDNFSIRRDKLLGMPIRNEVPVSVELRYRRRR